MVMLKTSLLYCNDKLDKSKADDLGVSGGICKHKCCKVRTEKTERIVRRMTGYIKVGSVDNFRYN